MPPRVRSSQRRKAQVVGPPPATASPSVATAPRSTRADGSANTTTPTVAQAKSNKSGRTNNQRKNANTSVTRLEVTPTIPGPSQRAARERKARTTYSPSAQGPTRAYTRRRGDTAESALSSGVADADLAPDERCRRLEARVRSHVKQLRYLQTFLEAYEAEGWRRASREKLKPSKELATARRKMAVAKRHVVSTLHEIDALRRQDLPIPYLIELETQPMDEAESGQTGEHEDAEANAERIYCSRCSSTVTTEDNDILLCDNEGCFRAFHQQCQVPAVRTQDIPQGDEPWFCASCIALFNALKAINYACDTTHEKIEDVFPDLAEEEQSVAAEGDLGTSTAEGTGEEDDVDGAADDDVDDEEDDEDFVVEDAELKAVDTRDDSQSDSEDEGADTSADEGVVESDVSDDELHHLDSDDVIDSNRRSMRSHGDHLVKKSYLSERVATQTETGDVMFGVVVEKEVDNSAVGPQWRVVYYNDTMSFIDEEAVVAGIKLAVEHSKLHRDTNSKDELDEVDKSLIVRGKRKRSRVDYRALNELMFDGKEDSDAGGDEHVESEFDDDAEAERTNGDGDDEDEDFEPPRDDMTNPTHSVKRGRRERRPVDYRAMHEGVERF